jgi:hypothetical protein
MTDLTVQYALARLHHSVTGMARQAMSALPGPGSALSQEPLP